MESHQLTLFQSFLCPDAAAPDDMSNTLKFWDALPKYHIPREQQAKLADSSGRLPTFKRNFSFGDDTYTIEIQPAQVERNGGLVDVYPAETEELIEDVLRKFLADQNAGYFDETTRTACIYFTLDRVRKELRQRGKTRSYQEIVEALEILASCVLTIRKGAKAMSKDVIVSVTGVSRDEYLADPRSRWVATFHQFIMHSIAGLDYRQMNYGLLMELRAPLTRYLYRRLCANYTYAEVTKPYHFLYSTLRDETEYFRGSRPRDHVKRIDASLEDLNRSGLIPWFDKEERRGKRRTLLDVCYTLYAGGRLRDEAVVANRNAKQRRDGLERGSKVEADRTLRKVS